MPNSRSEFNPGKFSMAVVAVWVQEAEDYVRRQYPKATESQLIQYIRDELEFMAFQMWKNTERLEDQ